MKRIPVYLSEEELVILTEWAQSELGVSGLRTDKEQRLIALILEKLDTFSEEACPIYPFEEED